MESDKKYTDLNNFLAFLKDTTPNGSYPGDEINYAAENIQKNPFIRNGCFGSHDSVAVNNHGSLTSFIQSM